MHDFISSTYTQTHLPVLILKISDYKQKHWRKFISPAQQFTSDPSESLLLNLQLDALLGFKSKLCFRCPRVTIYSTNVSSLLNRELPLVKPQLCSQGSALTPVTTPRQGYLVCPKWGKRLWKTSTPPIFMGGSGLHHIFIFLQ